MQRPVDVIVTGFTKSLVLLQKSLTPLRLLKQEGVIRNIFCVTWDSTELDQWVLPINGCSDIRLVRLPQPVVEGGATRRGVLYQIENLRAGLELAGDDAVILKWRPDMVANYTFLRDKILGFPQWSAIPSRNCMGVTMPRPVFNEKIWVPWADSNSPFFHEDAVFMGARREIEKLIAPLALADQERLEHPHNGAYAHIVRYARPFLDTYPIFANYLRNIHLFRHDLDYRMKMVPLLVDNGFSWHLLIAHAWILYSQFHVDAGNTMDLAFYSNYANRDVDWSNAPILNLSPPYDDVASWREDTVVGTALRSVSRAFGRLMDDGWQRELFMDRTPDFPRETLAAVMGNVAGYADGRLAGLEADFYQTLDRLYRGFHALPG